MDNNKILQRAGSISNIDSIQASTVNIHMGNIHMSLSGNYENQQEEQRSANTLFGIYIEKAIAHWSMKKTLLYEHQPHSFYELYVCNNLAYYKSMISENQGGRWTILNDATPDILDKESKYIIIAGTGGIGKSMFLTHLFLSAARDYAIKDKLPVLVTLKDYREKTQGIIDFIWKSVKAFSPRISRQSIIAKLDDRNVLLMLDGFDELQSSLREKFNADLDDFIKAYPGNNVVMTSRPINSFVSYSRFSVFNIEPLTKNQALQLIRKLSYWDEEAKINFIKALDKELYQTHKEFASNPLLLTIMLMTYTTFGEVPTKMPVFYAKAYETMARLHDATKGSYQRPFYTKLTPEELRTVFAGFCARTYQKEKIEFTNKEFTFFMDKAIAKSSSMAGKNVSSQDFLLDLTNNLCIMYREGEKYYFIHRSFQEYFAALYFAFDYDENLRKVGAFFERKAIGVSTDRTFDMLYDMIADKVERYIFLPYLDELIAECEKHDDAYWEFLERLYPYLYYEYGTKDRDWGDDDDDDDYYDIYHNEAQSFLYRMIIQKKGLKSLQVSISDLPWPRQLFEPHNKNMKGIHPNVIELMTDQTGDLNVKSEHPYYRDTNITYQKFYIDIKKIRTDVSDYFDVHKYMESSEFPLREEYNAVKKYYTELKTRTLEEQESEDLFDD